MTCFDCVEIGLQINGICMLSYGAVFGSSRGLRKEIGFGIGQIDPTGSNDLFLDLAGNEFDDLVAFRTAADIEKDPTIMDDFMLTNTFFEEEIRAMRAQLSQYIKDEAMLEELMVTGRGVYAPYMQNAIDYIKEKAYFWRDGTVITPQDHIVILSTCSADITNGRFILVGKILDHTVANPFPEEVRETDARIDIVNSLNSILKLPAWQWILILLAIILLIYLAYRLSRRRDERKHEKKLKDNDEK